MRKRCFFLAVCFGALIVLPQKAMAGGENEKTTKPLPEEELSRYNSCGDDRDCVKAVNGCCDCANGGFDVAVNKERLEKFRDRFDCLYVTCTERARLPQCGTGVVSCVDHRCKYFELDEIKRQLGS